MSRIVQECTRLKKKVKGRLSARSCAALRGVVVRLGQGAALRRFRETGHTRNRWNLTPVHTEIACEIQGKRGMRTAKRSENKGEIACKAHACGQGLGKASLP